MTKKLIAGFVLFSAVLLPLAAQQREEGQAARHDSEEPGFFATHRTYPFGTQLVITNVDNNAQVTVQVGGRPADGSSALVELSPEAANKLNCIKRLTNVRVDAVVRETTQRVQRLGTVKQQGVATILSGGGIDDLIAYHPSIAIRTRVKLTNATNGRAVIVTVQNRIRASKDRIIEISPKAARDLGLQNNGIVRLETITN